MKLSLKLTNVLAIGLAALPGAHAWGAAGHEIVATVAQIYLHPTVLPALCPLLFPNSSNPEQCHLAQVATWADRVRNMPGWRWSASLHYIGAKDDHPSQTCAFPGEQGWAGRRGANVLGAIRNITTILKERVRDPEALARTHAGDDDEYDPMVSEALKFLVHFIGDMHMPLHLTGRDRGGNGAKVRFDGRLTNLHSVWDSRLIAQALRTIPRNYSRPLPYKRVEAALRDTIYDPYVRRLVHEGLMPSGRWAEDVGEWLSCPATTPSSVSSSSRVGAALERVLGAPVADAWTALESWWTGPEEDTDDDAVCPYYWAAPIHQLNCDIVWPAALDEPPYARALPSIADILSASESDEGAHLHAEDPEDEAALFRSDGEFGGGPRIPYLELDTPEYAGQISKQWVVERLLATGGVRLAGVLNWLFADLDEEELKSLGEATQTPFVWA